MEAQFEATNKNITNVNSTVAALGTKVGVNKRNLDRLKNDVETVAKKTSEDIAAAVQTMEDRDKSHRDDIKRIEAAIDDIRGLSAGKISNDIRRELSCEASRSPEHRPDSLNPRAGTKSSAKEEKYWASRRRLRVWPVKGTDEEEMWRELERFFSEMLRFPVQNLTGEDFESIKRTLQAGRHSRVKDEIIIGFSSVSTRDQVASYAKNLAAQIDSEGLPTAGLRPDIPDFLIGVHKDLEQYGRFLKRSHGAGLKRSIKFDDSALTMFMDVKLPNSDEWMKIGWNLAREELSLIDSKNAASTRRRLMSSTSSNNESESQDTLPSTAPLTGANAMPASQTLRRFSRPSPSWGNRE